MFRGGAVGVAEDADIVARGDRDAVDAALVGVKDEFGDLEAAAVLAFDGGEGMSLPGVDFDGEVGEFGWFFDRLTKVRFGFVLSLDSWV